MTYFLTERRDGMIRFTHSSEIAFCGKLSTRTNGDISNPQRFRNTDASEARLPPVRNVADGNGVHRVVSVLLFALAGELSTLDPVPGAFCFEPPAFAKTLKLALKLRLGHPPLYRGKPQDYGGTPFPVATCRSGIFG